MALGYLMITSPYTPYSIYLRGTISLCNLGLWLETLQHKRGRLQALIMVSPLTGVVQPGVAEGNSNPVITGFTTQLSAPPYIPSYGYSWVTSTSYTWVIRTPHLQAGGSHDLHTGCLKLRGPAVGCSKLPVMVYKRLLNPKPPI